MKKITFLAVLFIAGMTLQAQTSFTGTGNGDITDLGVAGSASGNPENIVITHSVSQVIEAGEEIACASPTSFRDNWMYRDFDLVNDFGITADFAVTDVEFAMGPVITPAGFTVTVNIYSTSDAFPPLVGTLQGTALTMVTNADAESMIAVPLEATIPFGERMIMEVVLLDDGTDTNFCRFGCNQAGQTGPSYIDAPACGTTMITDFAALGLTQGLVWNVLGDEVLGVNDNLLSQISVYPNPARDVLNVNIPASVEVNTAVLYDVLGKNTGVRLMNGTMNTSNLARGIYMLNVNTSAGTFTQKVVKQ